MSTHTIEYTRTSVAFPGIPILHNDVDDLHIHEVDGDGEFRIAFIDLTTVGVVPHLEVFGDGLELFYDPRVQNVMHRWRRAERNGERATIERFIVWLEAEGCVPSRYQRAALKRETVAP